MSSFSIVKISDLFLDICNIREYDIRRTRPGLYFEWIENIDGI